MLTALHALIHSDDPAATRAFLRDVLRWPFVSEGAEGDAGVGGAGTGGTDAAEWLIFRSGPSEVAVHPTTWQAGDEPRSVPRQHTVALICDDLATTMDELRGRGAEFSTAPRDAGYGVAVMLKVPGADDLLLYQDTHAVAYSLPDDAGHQQRSAGPGSGGREHGDQQSGEQGQGHQSGEQGHRHGEQGHRHGEHEHRHGEHEHGEHQHGGRRMPVTDDEWHQHYAPEAIWSGNPNGALVAELAGLTPGRAVDVGCGEGADAVWLAGQGWQVTAFDVAESALERGRAAAESAGVEVEWVRAGLLSSELQAGAFDLVSACYPALQRTPERLAEQALLRLVAPGGRLLMLAHADVDRTTALEHGFDPDDYLDPGDLLTAASDGWSVERHERRPRRIDGGAGAGHHTDIVLVLRREQSA